MYLTKLFQVVKVGDSGKVFHTARSQEDCDEWLEQADYRDYMSDLFLTVIPIWTNASEKRIKDMCRK